MSIYNRVNKPVLRRPVEPELASLVGVPDQTASGSTMGERHREGVGDELGAQVVGHRPADDPAAVEILHGDEVEPALPGTEVGDVGDPAAVRGAGGEVAVEEIVGDSDAGHPDGGCPPLLGDQAGEAGLAHQPLDAFAADPLAVVEDEIRPDPRRAIDAAALAVQLTDPFGQPRVLERTRPGRPLRPGVIAGAADLEHTAHDHDRVRGLLRSDEPVRAHRVPPSRAKKAAAFFRISRSSASTRFSRRNLRSSSRSAELSPSALPSSTSSWTNQLRNDCADTPSSRASCGTERPLLRSNLTASERNSNEYGGIFGINRHPSRPSELSQKMSMKAGELQSGHSPPLRPAPTTSGTAHPTAPAPARPAGYPGRPIREVPNPTCPLPFALGCRDSRGYERHCLAGESC